ncbi:MAG: calcium-binding protein [Beijerinckiaceae bacterium]
MAPLPPNNLPQNPQVATVYTYGTQADENFKLGDAPNIAQGGGGNDYIIGGAMNDMIWGGIGEDTLEGGGGNDNLYGGIGNDVLNGGAGDDFMTGDYGNDIFQHSSGNDVMQGGDGTDIFWLGMGQDKSYGGEGNDLFVTDTSVIRGIGKFHLGLINGGEGAFDVINLHAMIDPASVKLKTYASGEKSGVTYLEWKTGLNTYTVDITGVEMVEFNGQTYDIGQFII